MAARGQLEGFRPSREQREWLAAWGLSVLTLAQQRITEDELSRLSAIVAAMPEVPSGRSSIAPAIELWLAIARATREPMIVETAERWAAGARRVTGGAGGAVVSADWPIPKATYRGLLLALRRGSGAPELWSHVMDELFG